MSDDKNNELEELFAAIEKMVAEASTPLDKYATYVEAYQRLTEMVNADKALEPKFKVGVIAESSAKMLNYVAGYFVDDKYANVFSHLSNMVDAGVKEVFTNISKEG